MRIRQCSANLLKNERLDRPSIYVQVTECRTRSNFQPTSENTYHDLPTRFRTAGSLI